MPTALADAPLPGTTARPAAVLGNVPCTTAATRADTEFTFAGRLEAAGSAAHLPSADRFGPFPAHAGHAC